MTLLLSFRALSDNLIWALVGPDGDALLIDPGEAAPAMAAIDAGLRVSDILITHHHADHTGGVPELVLRTGAHVHAPAEARLRFPARAVVDGECFMAAGMSVEVLAVPGHTNSHVAFLVQGHLFCGDALFSLGCGRLFEGSPAQMAASLARLATLPGETLVCCGHEYTLANGEFARAAEPHNVAREHWLAEARHRLSEGRSSLPSTIAIERAANPFLRVSDNVERFAALREWKDRFA